MSMLDRIKKRQWDGLKDFVESLEVTGGQQKQQILLNGILEDPIFMRWVTRNLRSFNDFLALSSDDIELVLRTSDAIVSVMAKALPVTAPDDLAQYAQTFPRHFAKIRDEHAYLTGVKNEEREAAQYFVLKTARKLQREERIRGFTWHLPPQEVFFPDARVREGVLTIQFEDGTVAAEGEVLKGLRIGIWRHYYDNGRLLAEGNYQQGIKTGPWTFYYGNGEKRAAGRYMNDLRHGQWTEWTREGEAKKTEWVEGKKSEG